MCSWVWDLRGMSNRIDHSRKGLTVLVGVFVVILLSGCTGGAATVCSAVGYIRTLTVELTGDATQIQDVRLCDRDGACSGLDGLDPTVSSPGPLGDDIPPYTASGSANSWSFTMPNQPEEVTITAYYADGTIAAEATTDVVWEDVGDTTNCKGPAKATPVIMPLN